MNNLRCKKLRPKIQKNNVFLHNQINNKGKLTIN
jgi:hypothetical protein